MKSQELFMVLLACLCVMGCDKVPKPRSSISVRSDVTYADFMGKWTGQTTDKPGEGGTSDTMELYVQGIFKPRLEAFVLGTFPLEGNQKIDNIHLVDNKIGFYMSAMAKQSYGSACTRPKTTNSLVRASHLSPTVTAVT